MKAPLVLSLLCCLHLPVAVAEQAPRRYSIEQLMSSDALAGVSFSPDGKKLLFSSIRTGVANLYEMPIRGGQPHALTISKEPQVSLGYFPRDERVLYASDRGGNELTHIYVREVDGSTRDLTPGEKLRARFVAWAPDGRSFFVATNERDARFFDLYEYQADGYARRLLFQNDAGYQIRAVSPDRRYVAVSRIVDNANTLAYLYDTDAKELTQLTPTTGNISSEPQVFSRDGSALFLTTDEGREFQFLARMDLKSRTQKAVVQMNWDVSDANLSADGRYLVVSSNEDARTRIQLLDPQSLRTIRKLDTGAHTVISFTVASGKPLAAFVQANGAVPGDLYTLDLRNGHRTRLLQSLAPEVDQADLVPGEVVRFKSYDGLIVPGVLYVPRGLAKNGSNPAVIWVHGGPGDESRIGYTPLLQVLANRGYVVYAVNNRGSHGSGRKFYHLDDRKHGDADLDDVVASRQMLIDSGYVDGKRIAVAGSSYGGYMTLAALAFRPDAFAAGIDLYGVANWPRLLQSTPAWWEDLRRLLNTEMGDPVADAEYLESISPVFHAGKIVKPLLVLQGANDPRVMRVESDDMVAKVRANGVPVEYVVFPDEGHGFRKRANEIAAYRAVELFLEKHVKGAAQTESQRLNAFFEQVFQRDLARSPIRESRLGIKTHQDKWDDVSDAHAIENAALVRNDLQALRQFSFAKLDRAAQLSYRLFERKCKSALEAFEWRRSGYLLTQMGGIHRSVATTLLNSHPIADRKDAEAYVARLRAVKPLMEQLVVELYRQEVAKVQPPRFVYDLTIGEADNLLVGRPFDDAGRDSPLLADFLTKLAQLELSEEEKRTLATSAETALRTGLGPGYRHLIAHLRDAQRTATDDAGVWKLPKGDAYYRFALESYTTLDLTPEAVHVLGLKEVARIHTEMRGIMQQLGFTGTLETFFERMRSDPSLYYADSSEGRAQYLKDAEELLATARTRQSEMVGRVPKMDVVVKAVEPWREQSAAKAFYSTPPRDGSRPGIFYINLYDVKAQPRYQLPVVLFHEAIPGHHVETVVAYELQDVPAFRKFASEAAFSEGWGLYSEELANEMGLYRDPYEQFGRLSLALMRATRLVVDTGIHAKRWTREQAVDYLDRNMPGSHYDNQREIDRYIVMPGQATAYLIGKMKIMELRERARRILGARFDLRGFHDAVLGDGPLPLPVLEDTVNAWIDARREAP